MKRILNISTFLLFCCITALFAVPRAEYPRPQFERASWVNLNGEWTCSFDFGGSGMERGFYKSKGFDKKITVPFCPESKLSGIGYTVLSIISGINVRYRFRRNGTERTSCLISELYIISRKFISMAYWRTAISEEHPLFLSILRIL